MVNNASSNIPSLERLRQFRAEKLRPLNVVQAFLNVKLGRATGPEEVLIRDIRENTETEERQYLKQFQTWAFLEFGLENSVGFEEVGRYGIPKSSLPPACGDTKAAVNHHAFAPTPEKTYDRIMEFIVSKHRKHMLSDAQAVAILKAGHPKFKLDDATFLAAVSHPASLKPTGEKEWILTSINMVAALALHAPELVLSEMTGDEKLFTDLEKARRKMAKLENAKGSVGRV